MATLNPSAGMIARLYPPLLTFLGAAALLEAASRLHLVGKSFPPVTQDLAALAGDLVRKTFWVSVLQTLEGWFVGLCIAVVAGVLIGVIVGVSPLIYRATRPLIEFLRPIPSVALIPLVVLLYGLGMTSKLVLIVFASVWPILIQTTYGVREPDDTAINTARVLGIGRLRTTMSITLRAAMPLISTGVRIASTIALMLAIIAELVIGSPGLGNAVNLARSAGQFDRMYGLIICTGLIGWLLNSVFMALERRVLWWHGPYRRYI